MLKPKSIFNFFNFFEKKLQKVRMSERATGKLPLTLMSQHVTMCGNIRQYEAI